ncbi:hypothetical protein KCU88_g2755, partial [Aureobasidium melanogenum]
MSIEYLVLHYITDWVQNWIRYIRNKPRTTIQPPVEPAADTVETQNPDFPLDSRAFSGAELFASNVWTEEVVILNHEIPEDVFGSRNADGKPSGIKEEINVLHNCRLFQAEEAVFSPNCPVLQPNHDIHVMTGIDLISSPKETVASDLIVWQSSRQQSTSSQTTTNWENENDWFKDGPDGREWHPLIPGEKRRLRREVLELREELARQMNLFQQQNGMLEEQRTLLERAEEEKRTLQAKKAEDAVAKAAFIAELKAEVVDKAKQAEAAQANDAQKEAVIANLEASLASAKKEIEELQATAVASDIKEKAQESALETLETSVALKEEQIKDLQEELNALEEANKAAEEAVVSLKAQVEAKDAKVSQQKKFLATAEASAKEQANELEKHQGNLAALEVSKEVLIKEHKEAVAVLEASLEAKDKAAQLAFKAKEAEIEEHKVARAALEAAIKKKEDEVKDQATTLAGLETSLHLKEDELRQVQSTLDALMTEKEDAARGNQAKVSLLEKELTMVKKAMAEAANKAEKEVQSAKEGLANEIKGQLSAFGALEAVVDSKNLEINELKEAMASQRSQIEELQQLVKKAEAARVEEMEKSGAAEKACQEEQEEREEEDDDDWETVDEEEDDEPQTAVASPTWGPESEGATFSQTRTDCLTEPEVATPVVAMVFSEELDSSFTTTAATAEGALPSPEDTPRRIFDIPLPASPALEAELPSVNGTGSVLVSPALITSVVSDKEHIFTEMKVNKGKFGPGALLQSKWATPTTPTTPTTPAPAPAPTTSAATPAPVSLPSATQDSPNSLFDPTPTPAKAEPQVVKKTPGTLMTSKWASTAAAAVAPSPLATATPLVPTPGPSSPAPSTPSKRPEEAKGKEKDHIFYEVKVKKGGAGPGQMLLSKWATPPAATPAAGPPTRPKTKVERIASQNAERGLPESTPNRPKTKAEREAEAEAGDK